jgi:hypothetical protein
MGEVDASMFPNWLIFLFAALSPLLGISGSVYEEMDESSWAK